MRKADKVKRIAQCLDEFYPEQPIPLDHRDPYSLLVAVMLSAQTTDKKVNEVTPALFALGDTPQAMAQVQVSEILETIRVLGLAPTKAKNLRRLSEQLVQNFGGEVPADIDALETLAGVGHKTASVVVSQAFGIPAFPVDTHIHRLARRWALSSGRNVVQTERDLKRLFPKETWNVLHLQIIFFGREHCPARGHDFDSCPICSWASPKTVRAAERKAAQNKKKGRTRL
jgi:endonuclease-3